MTTYAGGGGGGQNGAAPNVGYGGSGGGGYGGGGTVGNAVAGTANLGGGGGGAEGGSYLSGSGGSGVAIISYPDVYANASTQTNATYSTTGSGSLSLVYANQPALAYPANGAFGTGDFCIELFLYYGTQSSAAPYIASNTVGASSGSWLWYIQTNMQWYINGAAILLLNTSSIPTQDAWNHLVVCRTSSVTSFFLNGTRTATASDTNNYSYSSATTAIGSNTGNTNWLVGNISNFRMVVGSSPYNASASSITVPTSPLTAIAGTQLLLNTVSGSQYVDTSTNSFISSSPSSNIPPWLQESCIHLDKFWYYYFLRQ
jgi:hypothetical protein